MPQDTLLTRCQGGDQAAWKTLFDNYSRAVFRWALFFGISENGAEEVTQEVFITAARKISQCSNEGHLPAWLFQITRKHAANFRRNRWFKDVFPLGRLESNENAQLGRQSNEPLLSLEIQQILQGMPVKLLEVLIMHDLDGCSRDEIAKQVGIPAGTVASRLEKARGAFKKRWSSIR